MIMIIQKRGTHMNDQTDVILLNRMFDDGWTPQTWSAKPVGRDALEQLMQRVAMPPTSGNGQHGRFIFVSSPEARERLAALARGRNQDKIRQAPVTAIIAYDPRFFDALEHLYPVAHVGQMIARFENDPELAQQEAFRNSTLQGAYFILAARAAGLDCGPMSGFDNEAVDREFLSQHGWKSNFLCTVGYGEDRTSHKRNPRPSVNDNCRFI
jgi:3-hydroxypropanoate dehydrogenase